MNKSTEAPRDGLDVEELAISSNKIVSRQDAISVRVTLLRGMEMCIEEEVAGIMPCWSGQRPRSPLLGL